MKLVLAPEEYFDTTGSTSLFLGGGISNCKDWQSRIVNDLSDKDVTIYNPRRVDFDVTNPNLSSEQIRWEHKYLRSVNLVTFYFCEETLCPITLFELGATLERSINSLKYQRIFIYCEPNYKRAFDVRFQTMLAIRSFYDQENTSNIPFFADVFDTYDSFIKKLREEIIKLSY